MAVTNRQIIDFLLANPGMSDADIVAAMETYRVSPAQMAQAVGVSEGEVVSRVAVTVPQGQTITLGDTIIAPEYRVIGSGEDQQIGNLETIYTSKTTGDPNYRAPVGSEYQQYGADGTFQRTGVTQEVNAGKDFLKFALGGAALFGGLGGGFESLFGGGGAAGTAGTVGSTGLTMGELAQLDLALGGTGGTAGALNIAGLAGGTGAGTLFESLNAGAGAGTDYLGGSLANVGTAGTIGNTGLTLSELTQLDLSLGGAGGTLGALTLAEQLGGLAAGTLTAGLLTSGGVPITPYTPVMPTTPVVPPTVPPVVPPVVPPTGIPPVVPPVVPTTGVPPFIPTSIPPVADLIKTGLTAAQIAALLATSAQTAGGLLQQQTSREAAQKAQAMIDRETAAAKAGAQFRPIGMTTRFGSSQFVVDPTTGRLTSAGYTLSPEAKNAQDRFVKLAESGLVQAEGAQAQFAPLQTGATSLFTLGNKYLAKSPEDVAKDYLASQMALLQPGRELELANLQNKLTQQGRGGLSVAQGGTYGATTPELQALYNARARQEAELAANAQQLGQRDVLFGAGLLNQGAQTMGQYYGGQQQAYSPYTTAMGQVTGLESAAQQPFQMGVDLGKIGATTGFDAGRLGLQGAGQSVALATGPAATNNPYASLLTGAASSPVLTEAAAKALVGLFS